MTNEQIDAKLAELDQKHTELERVKADLLRNVDEIVAEELRIQGEYRVYKKMKADIPAPVPVV